MTKKKCTCGKTEPLSEYTYIGDMKHLRLYNCKHCSSTVAVVK